MQLELTREGAVLTAALIGELDHHAAADLRQKIDAAMLSCRPRRLNIDLTRLTFMDSSGIAVLLRIHRRAGEMGGDVTVRGVPDQAMRVLRAAGLPKLMKFE